MEQAYEIQVDTNCEERVYGIQEDTHYGEQVYGILADTHYEQVYGILEDIRFVVNGIETENPVLECEKEESQTAPKGETTKVRTLTAARWA